MRIHTYVIAHTPEIILQWHEYFSALEPVTWCAVSQRDFSAVEHLSNVVVCHNLPHNREANPELLHFTAYDAMVKNGLLDPHADYFRWLEWDARFVPGYPAHAFAQISRTRMPIYVHHEEPYSHCWTSPQHLIELTDKGLREMAGVEASQIQKLARNQGRAATKWAVTLNFIMNRQNFFEFHNYAERFLPYFLGQRQAGNNLERLLTVFAVMHNRRWDLLQGLKNSFSNSHGTS